MPKEFSRTQRMAELIQRELALLIQREMNDPRLASMVTISAVKVSPSFGYAKVYIDLLDKTDDNLQDTLTALNHAAGFLRTHLAKTIPVKRIPRLNFVYDESIEYGNRLTNLIDDANE